MKAELDAFEQSLNDLSKNTKYNYKLDVKCFLNWSNNEPISKDLLDEYREEIIDLYAIKTVNRKINSLNAYLKFKGINIHLKSEKIQQQTFVNDMLSNQDVENILKVVRENNDLRAEAFIFMLYYTGVRVSELLQLKLRNIGKDEINVKGKGDKYRKVLIPEKCANVIYNYVHNGRKTNVETPFVFVGERGAITRNTIFRTLKEYAELAGVDKNKVYPHAFRHLYPKNLSNKGVSYSAIKQLLGHSLSTTDIYMQLSKKELLEIINSLSLI